MEICGHEDGYTHHLLATEKSRAPCRVLRQGAFCFVRKKFEKVCVSLWHFPQSVVEGQRKGINKPPPGRKGGENMNNERFEWQTRCEFNAYCKHTLRNELINASKESKRRQQREVIFSDLAPHEERQLFTVDKYFANEEKDDAFRVGDLKITAKLLAEALRTLPDEKRKAVLLYYFVNKSDVEIAEELGIPRSTVQYRRTSSFEQLKRYLEERADEWDEW